MKDTLSTWGDMELAQVFTFLPETKERLLSAHGRWSMQSEQDVLCYFLSTFILLPNLVRLVFKTTVTNMCNALGLFLLPWVSKR